MNDPQHVHGPDENQLHLICILHYVFALFSTLVMVAGGYIAFGYSMSPEELAGNDWQWSDAYDALFFNIVIDLGGWVLFILGASLLILSPLSGYCIQKRKWRRLSLMIARISCLVIPFGTVLGALTIVTLQRPTVRALYLQPRT